MKHLSSLLMFIFLFTVISSISQDIKTKIYIGNNTNFVNLSYTIDDKHIYRGETVSYLSIEYSFTDTYVCKGTNVNYVYRTYHLLRDEGVIKTRDGIVLYHIKDNKIYNAANTNVENCMYILDENHMYSGCLTNFKNIMYTFTGEVDIYLIACLLGGF